MFTQASSCCMKTPLHALVASTSTLTSPSQSQQCTLFALISCIKCYLACPSDVLSVRCAKALTVILPIVKPRSGASGFVDHRGRIVHETHKCCRMSMSLSLGGLLMHGRGSGPCQKSKQHCRLGSLRPVFCSWCSMCGPHTVPLPPSLGGPTLTCCCALFLPLTTLCASA